MARRIRCKAVWAVLFAAVLLLGTMACAEGTQCIDQSGNVYNEHHWIESVVCPPTCQSEGYTLFYCTQCGSEYTGNRIPAGEEYHSWQCVDDGPETHHEECGHCERKKASTPHTWTKWYTSSEDFAADYGILFPSGQLKAPTCMEDGTKGRYCAGCGYAQTAKADALGHDPIWTVVKAATCVAEGLQSGKCSRCSADTGNEVIPVLGHDPVSHAAKAPTCTEAGWETYETCAREGCKYTTYKEIPATGHVLAEDPEVAATCEQPGKTAGSHCSVCGKVIDEQQEVPATGHKPAEDAAVEPTCEQPGKTAGSHCSVCGKVIDEQQEVPATGHKPVEDAAVEPTCEQPGKTAGSHCSVCGAVIGEQKEIPAAGHKPVEDPAVAATCEEPGQTAGSHCSVCSKVIDEPKEVAATGHSYGEPAWRWSGNTADAMFTCSSCGNSVTVQASVSEIKEADGVRRRAAVSLDGKSYENELINQDEEKEEADNNEKEAAAPGDPGDIVRTAVQEIQSADNAKEKIESTNDKIKKSLKNDIIIKSPKLGEKSSEKAVGQKKIRVIEIAKAKVAPAGKSMNQIVTKQQGLYKKGVKKVTGVPGQMFAKIKSTLPNESKTQEETTDANQNEADGAVTESDSGSLTDEEESPDTSSDDSDSLTYEDYLWLLDSGFLSDEEKLYYTWLFDSDSLTYEEKLLCAWLFDSGSLTDEEASLCASLFGSYYWTDKKDNDEWLKDEESFTDEEETIFSLLLQRITEDIPSSLPWYEN